MCPGRREGKGMMGAWCIDCVYAVEVGHNHVHSFFAELAQLIDRIFYVNF